MPTQLTQEYFEEKIDELARITANGFVEVHERFTGVEQRLDGVEQRLDGVEQRLDGVEQRLNRVESLMVTKDYLDEKLADLRGDLVVLTRKEDAKVIRLIEFLRVKNILGDAEVKELLGMEPFAKLVM